MSPGEYFSHMGGDSRMASPAQEVSGSELERRREKLQAAKKSIIDGSHLHVIDNVDVFKCEYLEAGEGVYEVVYEGAVVGYSKEPIVSPPEGIVVH